jgi:purine-binding chemotaxis protein CheW
MTAMTSQGTLQFCTFMVANHYFGIEVTKVQEVLRQQVLTFVPKAPPEIAGLLNLRGQILPAINLKNRLGFPDDDNHSLINVIINTQDGPVDLLADRVGDVLTLDDSTWEASHDSVEGRLKEVIIGIHKLKDRLLLVIDPTKVANLDG